MPSRFGNGFRFLLQGVARICVTTNGPTRQANRTHSVTVVDSVTPYQQLASMNKSLCSNNGSKSEKTAIVLKDRTNAKPKYRTI